MQLLDACHQQARPVIMTTLGPLVIPVVFTLVDDFGGLGTPPAGVQRFGLDASHQSTRCDPSRDQIVRLARRAG